MKTTSTKLKQYIAYAVVAIMLSAISDNIQAQVKPKPKGKPWPAPEEYISMQNPVKLGDSTLIFAKDIYTEHCKSCHGVKGKGDGPNAEKIDISCSDLSTAEFAKVSDGEAYWKITEGRKPMPSYSEKLTDDERWMVIYYLRTLGKSK